MSIVLKFPPVTGELGPIKCLKATLHADTVWGWPQLVIPWRCSLDPVKSIFKCSPLIVTVTLTSTGSSVTPSLSRYPTSS